jgi:hypothetical protein
MAPPLKRTETSGAWRARLERQIAAQRKIPDSLYDNLPLANSLDEAERRVKVWEASQRKAATSAHR